MNSNVIVGRKPCGCIAIACQLPLSVKAVTLALQAIEQEDLAWDSVTTDAALAHLGTCNTCDPSTPAQVAR